MSKIEKKFLKWFEAEKKKGLKDINFFFGDLSQFTMDSFLEEFMDVNEAIDKGNYFPFPDSF